MNLTEAGRRLREKGLTMNLIKQTRLPPEEFAKLQKAVSNLRNSLMEAVGEIMHSFEGRVRPSR